MMKMGPYCRDRDSRKGHEKGSAVGKSKVYKRRLPSCSPNSVSMFSGVMYIATPRKRFGILLRRWGVLQEHIILEGVGKAQISFPW